MTSYIKSYRKFKSHSFSLEYYFIDAKIRYETMKNLSKKKRENSFAEMI